MSTKIQFWVLEKIESKIIDAKSALVEQEFLVLQELKESIWTITNDLNTFANHVAFLDLYTSHAIFSKENNLVKASYSENEVWKLLNEDI